MEIYRTRDSVKPYEGSPRVVACMLRTDTQFLTFAGDRDDDGPAELRYAIVGTDYGWLHNSAGDIRFWRSRSGAWRHLQDMTRVYGDKRDFPKIDLFDGRGRYLCSTTWARTCREALSHCDGAYSARFDKGVR